MVQTKKRGELDGFRRITWEQAAQYFKAKAEKVAREYGPGAFHNLYSSGMGGGYNPASAMFGLAGATATQTGGTMLRTHDDYSFPQWELITRCMHDANSQPRSNDFQDVYNSDELVIWCYNLSEMLNQQQINFTLTQVHEIFKKEGKRITVVDPKFTNTAILGADRFFAPIQGTDAAMICGMIHHVLTSRLPELGEMYAAHARVTDTEKDILRNPLHTDFAKTLRQAVGKYLYGFFDTNADDDAAGTNNSYMLDGSDQITFKDKAKAAPGASFSAYVFGSSNRLVNGGYNKGTSVYPDKIGYNVRSYPLDGDYDPLWDQAANRSRLTECYGQIEKTPEWAEKICGVPAADIEALADTFLTKNVSCWMMGGLQRNSEGDQGCWAWTILMNFFLCFGKEGRSHGRADGRGNDMRKSVSLGWSAGIKSQANLNALADPTKVAPYLNANKSGWAKPIGDTSLLTFPNNYNSNHSSDTISVFTWLDAAYATNREKINETRWTMEGGTLRQVTESFYPSFWNDGQIKRLPTPLKFIFHCGGNININQNGDCGMGVKVLTATDESCKDTTAVFDGVQMNPEGYKVEFLGMIEVVMTASCRWADLILPGSISFERYQTQSSGRSPLTSVTTKAVNPPGEAMVEMEIGAIMAKAFGQDADYFNGAGSFDVLAEPGSFEKSVWVKALNDPRNTAVFGMDAKAWKANGFHKPSSDLSKLENYIAYEAFLKNPGSENRPAGAINKAVNRTKTCFRTLSGRVEAYCMPLMENYEMRMGNNIDEGIDLVSPDSGATNGALYTKIAEARGFTGKGRFAYPVPMYIPLIEGRHADDTTHPDPMGIKGEYPFNLLTWHTIYRSHSTFNSSPLANEVMFYKRNSKGEQTYINRRVTNENAGMDNNDLKDTETSAPMVWTDDVYETVWMNPQTASEAGVAEGDIAILESLRGKVAVSVHVSNRVRYGTVSMTQGSWYNPVEDWVSPTGAHHSNVDVGGNANTLFGLRPCRIAHGMTLASECRLKVYKA